MDWTEKVVDHTFETPVYNDRPAFQNSLPTNPQHFHSAFGTSGFNDVSRQQNSVEASRGC